jgi:hypothetical protein
MGHFIVLISMLVWDYGPTIILEHNENQTFILYTATYLDSLEDLTLGAIYKKGQQIAALGDSAVNGASSSSFSSYKKHGIQWVITLVFVQSELDFYLDNCPGPNLLLKNKILK